MLIYKSICLNIIINIKNKQMEKNNIVKDLIIMFVTENYKKYLKENNIKFIEEKNVEKIIKELYIEKKDNLKVWLKECLKEMQKDEFMGDLAYNNLMFNIFQDDKLNCKRLELEIISYQKNKIN